MQNKVTIMEVCGTHTMAIARFGIRSLLPANVKLISGPGCPVCVTPISAIDKAIALAKKENVIITTFGDMLKVPGSYSSLNKERTNGATIKIVYSPIDALDIAKENPHKEIVFIGVGFETTSPLIAATIIQAKRFKITNFSVLCLFKVIPPALKFIAENKICKINAFLLPGHVSTIIGSNTYKFLASKYKLPGVIAGFSYKEITKAIKLLTSMVKNNKACIVTQCSDIVSAQGNKKAQAILSKVFKIVDSDWRAIGIIAKSGYAIKNQYASYDAEKKFNIKTKSKKEPKNCLCGAVMLGQKIPTQCLLFAKICTPSSAVGPCMVSSEGACAAEYKYGKNIKRK